MMFKLFDSAVSLKRMEVKQADDSIEVGVFEGYASTFGNEDRTGDVIAKGAFSKAIQEPVPLLWQHDMRNPIGIIAEWEQDDRGLKVMGEINMSTQTGRDAFNMLRAGHIKTMSVGFIAESEEEDRRRRRIIKDATLVEVSLVTIPANPQAKITDVRSMEDIEALAKSCATGMPFVFCKSMLQSEPDNEEREALDDLTERLQKLAAKFNKLG